jgi:uncharacterized protein YndB with AHSA1/START domain
MARRSASQHLAVLEAANLVSTVRRGREKLHHLNRVPLHEISERWIDKFETLGLRTLSAVRHAAEEQAMTEKPTYVYVTYIAATPEAVWHALTDADLTGRFWGHSNVSDWQEGSPWQHVRTDGSGITDVTGTVIETRPPERLVITFGGGSEEEGTPPSQVTFTIEPYQEIVRLTVRHEGLPTAGDLEAVSAGWPAVMANLKSLLETGRVLPQAPWEMHAELRAEQMTGHDPR